MSQAQALAILWLCFPLPFHGSTQNPQAAPWSMGYGGVQGGLEHGPFAFRSSLLSAMGIAEHHDLSQPWM